MSMSTAQHLCRSAIIYTLGIRSVGFQPGKGAYQPIL